MSIFDKLKSKIKGPAKSSLTMGYSNAPKTPAAPKPLTSGYAYSNQQNQTPLGPIKPVSPTSNLGATSTVKPTIAPPTKNQSTLPPAAQPYIQQQMSGNQGQSNPIQPPTAPISPVEPPKSDNAQSAYLKYLTGMFDPSSVESARKSQESALQKLADIQSRNEKQGLNARVAYENTLDKSGGLKSGAEQAASVGNRRASAESAYGAIEENAAARSAQVAQDTYKAYIDAGKSVYEAETAANTAKLDEDYRQQQLAQQGGFSLSEGEKRFDAQGNQIAYGGNKTYAPGSGSSSTGFNIPSTQSTGKGGGNISTLAQIAQEIAPTNSKFANEQFKANAQYYINSGDDVGLSNLIRKEAVNQLPSATIKEKYLNNITLIENLNRLEGIMGQLESSGVDTNLLTGTKQSILNKVGALGDAGLVDLTQQALNIRDLLARARTGAALTESEEKLYKKMVPSIFRTEQLNSQIAKNLRESLQQSIDSATGFSLSQQQQGALSGQGGVDDEYAAYLKSIGQ